MYLNSKPLNIENEVCNLDPSLNELKNENGSFEENVKLEQVSSPYRRSQRNQIV